MIGLAATHGPELAALLLEASPDGFLLVDADGMIRLANRSASFVFGYSQDELVGMPVEQLVPQDVRDRHVAHRAAFQATPGRRPMGTDIRLHARHSSGEMIPVEISLSPLTIDADVLTVATVRDVSLRQEALARVALMADRERIAQDLHELVIQRLFAVGMSLQSITNLMDSPVALERVNAATDELDETVRAIRSAIFQLGSCDSPQRVSAQVRELLRERSRHLGFVPDLHLQSSIDDLPDEVADHLVATLDEALANVARHAHATAAVVDITRTDDGVTLTVQDNGSGIRTNLTSRGAPVGGRTGGLSNVMWRAAELGGSCSISPAEPTGTLLEWHVPS